MGFMVGPERGVQSKVPQGPAAAGSPGFFCSLSTGTQAEISCASPVLAVSFFKIPM